MTAGAPLQLKDASRVAAPPLMLEREAELAAMKVMLGAAQSGDGRLVVVEGSAGIGKTRLLAEARALAVAAEFDVLTARGGELEGEFAFGIVRQLFEAPLAAATEDERNELLSASAGLSASLFTSAPTSSSGDAAESSFAMLHGLYWLAANFASRKPTLLVVDDLHWADEPSLRWLAYLARRIEGLPLLLLAGTRPLEQANSPTLVTELLSDPAAVAIRPGNLGPQSAAVLARERLGVEPDPVFAAALQTGSGGNPLFLVALLDALWQEGISPTPDQATYVIELGPQAIARGIATRLARLPEEAARLLRAAATLGDRTELSLAAMLADLEPKAALSAASALVKADLLRHENPLEFIHPVVRTAVLEEMSADERTDAHRRAAEILLGRGAVPEQAATYLVRTVPAGDPFVVATLRQAAERSLMQGAPEAATAYLRRALDEPPETCDRADVLGELGIAETHTDVLGAAAHLAASLGEVDDVGIRPDVVFAYARMLTIIPTGRAGESAELLLRLSERVDASRTELSEHIAALLIITCQFDPADDAIVKAQWERVNQHDSRTGFLLSVRAIEEGRLGEDRARSVELARRALRSELVETADRFELVNAVAALALAGEVDEALAGLARVIDVGQRRGDQLAAQTHELWRGLVYYEAGELLLAEETLAIVEPTPFWALSLPRAYRAGFLAHVLLERGKIDEAEEVVGAVSVDELLPGHRIQPLHGRGRVRLATGAAEQALADFVTAGEFAESVDIRNPAYIPWRSQSALALRQLERIDEARALARDELELSRRWGAPRTIGVSLHALGVVEGGEAGEQLLREAVAVLANSPARLEQARALIDLGAVLRRGNSRSEARQFLRQGIELAHRCGGTALVERANLELAATGAHPRTILLSGLDALTASERRVAQMAAEDLSNKEIAQALFVTVKTVEQHLGRVYRKLELSSRRQLAEALGRPAEVTPTA
jgi:DNA-binding CsgD family transcriptional regulator